MKFTFSWLKEHLQTEAAAVEIADRLTMIGHELESLTDRAAGLRDFVAAEIVACEKHPNADKLKVCVVNTGVRRLQVVCGAPNARTGLKCVFAAVGSVIPASGTVLQAASIRGVESAGMLLSMREMGLSDEHEGIVELVPDALVGAPAAAVLGLDDPLFDVAITPNRGDCLGVRGLARDLAAAGCGRLKPLPLSLYRLGLLETSVFSTGLKPLAVPVLPAHYPCPIGVRFAFPPEQARACPLFIGRLIRGVANGPSPRWLQDRLQAVGLRPISVLVDVTNLMTLDLCRPLHVFDAGPLRGGLEVRPARTGERLAALNGREYELEAGMTVIADAGGVQSLGGVIGGEATACTDETTDVFVESALFDPVRTAMTGRALGIHSDARFRFERGVDPAFVEPGIEEATRLIVHLCGGTPSDLVIAGTVPPPRPPVRFRPQRVASLTGTAIADDDSARILHDLGFGVDRQAPGWQVTVPTWRSDIGGEADLVEEVVRIAGYDRIPATPLPRQEPLPQPAQTPVQRQRSRARRTLAARGLTEAVTFSFLSPALAEMFGGESAGLTLVNPISADLAVMRPSILPNLITAAGRNADRGQRDAALFEVGPQYAGVRPDQQAMAAAGVRAGRTGPRHWAAPPRPVDAFDAKADVLALLAALAVPEAGLTLTTAAAAWYHPGRCGTLSLASGPALARFGEMHPRVLARLGIKGPMVAFEVMLEAIPLRTDGPAARPPLLLSALQPLERDFAFVVAESVTAEAVLQAVRSAGPALIAEASVFDVFAGGALDPGQKSLAVSVLLQPLDRTLTDAEIEALSQEIVAAVAAATGGQLRR
jgi:phenylalanyl-tRNA synthetase beta chain